MGARFQQFTKHIWINIYLILIMKFIFYFFGGGGNCPPEGFLIFDGYPPKKNTPEMAFDYCLSIPIQAPSAVTLRQ
jgi:hypothetical protein